jgi:hypothetical protein
MDFQLVYNAASNSSHLSDLLSSGISIEVKNEVQIPNSHIIIKINSLNLNLYMCIISEEKRHSYQHVEMVLQLNF